MQNVVVWKIYYCAEKEKKHQISKKYLNNHQKIYIKFIRLDKNPINNNKNKNKLVQLQQDLINLHNDMAKYNYQFIKDKLMGMNDS